jgi:outer membrane protein assembly factor BamB
LIRSFVSVLLVAFLVNAGCASGLPISPDWESTAGLGVLSLRWVKRLDPSQQNFLIPEMQEEHDRFNPVEASSAGFDTDKKRAFIGAAVGGLYCLDIFTGKTVWRFNLDDPIGSTPLYDSDRKYVFFGADDGRFYAVHARSGRQIWMIETGAEVRRDALLFDGTLYIINADNTVFAIDPDGGEVVWQYRRPPVEGFSASGYAGLTRSGAQLLTGFSDGYMVALDSASGNVNWTHDLAAEVVAVSKDGTIKLSDVDATPAVQDDVVVAASVAGGTQGLDVKSGSVLWTRPEITGVTGLAAEDGVVYLARSSYGLTAIDPQSGRIKWSREFDTGVLQDPVVHDDLLLISDSVFGMYVVSMIDGKLLQRINQYKGFFARPSLYGGYMLIIGNRGVLYAMGIL